MKNKKQKCVIKRKLVSVLGVTLMLGQPMLGSMTALATTNSSMEAFEFIEAIDENEELQDIGSEKEVENFDDEDVKVATYYLSTEIPDQESLEENKEALHQEPLEEKEIVESGLNKGKVVEIVSEIIGALEFDDVLENFGGRQVLAHVLSGRNHVSVPADEDSIDRFQLDASFENLKKRSESFVEQLLLQYPEFHDAQEEVVIAYILENLESFLLVKTYFDRWYSIEIDGQVLSEQMYFGFETTETILEIANRIKSSGDFLQSNLTGQTFRRYLSDFFEENTLVELVENFIFENTNSRDFDAWFEGFFEGEILTIESRYEELNLPVWEKLSNNLNRTLSTAETKHGTDNFLLPLITMERTYNMIIASAPGIIIYSSKNTYGDNYREMMRKGITNFTHHIEMMLDTHTDRDRILQQLRTIPVLDSERVASNRMFDYTDTNNHLSNGFFKPLQLTDQLHKGVNGFAGFQGITMALATVGEYPGTLAHEFNHSTGYIFMNGSRSSRFGFWTSAHIETIASRIHNNWYEHEGLLWVTYEAEEFARDSLSPLANSANRFQKPSDLQEYFGGYVGLIYALNQVVADVVLSLPIEEQVGFIRQWNPNDNTIRTLDAEEIRALNLTNTNDLVTHYIGIYDKWIPDGPVPSNDGFGSSYYSLDSQFFVTADGEMPNATRTFEFSIQMFDELMSLQDFVGWDAVNKFFSDASPVTNNLEALRYTLGDDNIDFKDFRNMQLDTFGSKVQEFGLRYDTYDELIELFSNNLDDLRGIKQQIYARYMSKTDEFRKSIFNEKEEEVIIYSEFKLGYWKSWGFFRRNFWIRGRSF